MKPDSDAPTQEAIRGTIDLTIGRVEGDERYLFGQTNGLELDDRGRIYVSDWQVGSVRAYGPSGDFLFQIGRVGGGPSEYRQYPSSITILSDGHLWILSFEDKVLRADPTQEDMSASVEAVLAGSTWGWLYDDLPALDADGMFIATGSEPDHRDGLRRRRVSLEDGRTVSKTNPWALRPTAEELGWRLSPRVTRAEVTAAREWSAGALAYLYARGGPPPYGAEWVMAFSTDGSVALAVTTTYRVDIYDSLLRPVTVIERDERGPRLTDAERRNVSAHMAERRRDEEYYPYGDGDIPDRKPPLRDLWFDRDGRLWLERYLADEPQQQGADVYGVDGEFLFSAEWPRGVDFKLGAIRGDTGLGIQTDALGIPRVVRVRFNADEAQS